MTAVVQFITCMLLMLVTGVFWGPWFALHRSLHIFNASEFVKIVKTLSTNMGNTMRILMPVCVVFEGISVFICHGNGEVSLSLTVMSLLFLMIALVITTTVELPIVTEISKYTSETLSPDWEVKRDRWVQFHRYRMYAGIISFACYVASMLLID